ncbi:hypothetical protein KP700603_04403 [Klebsiella quasipneumoniae]|nr:hypothetical protein KP700603_04403 [Klebsiella quasipneumoniae]
MSRLIPENLHTSADWHSRQNQRARGGVCLLSKIFLTYPTGKQFKSSVSPKLLYYWLELIHLILMKEKNLIK